MIGLGAGLALAAGTGSPLAGLLLCAGWLGASRTPARASLAGPASAGVGVLGALAVAAGWAPDVVLLGALGALAVVRRHADGADGRVPLLLVGLLCVVAATRTSTPLFGLAVLAVLGGLPRALGGPSWLGLAVGAGTALLFAVFPRLAPAVDRDDPVGLTGFTEDVELGAMEPLLDDPAPVLTARFSAPPDGPVYFRGVALDRFDGRRWSSESPRRAEPDWTGLDDSLKVDVELEAHPEGVLFVAGTVDGLDARGMRVERDTAGAYHLPGPARAVSYTVFAQPNQGFGLGRADPFVDARPVLDVPELSEDVQALVRSRVPDGLAPRERMDALSTWLRDGFTYTREPRDSRPEAPLAHFLLEERAGHCEYFASALAVGGRLVGVPTRVVNGFVGGEPQSDGSIVVRRYHAHSWVEYFDGEQWITADATPSVGAPTGPGAVVQAQEALEALWDAVIVGYDVDAQLAPARAAATALAPAADPGLRDGMGVGLVGGALALVGLLAWGVERRWVRRLDGGTLPPMDPVTRQLRDGVRAVREAGFAHRADLPDVAAARALRDDSPAVSAALEALAWSSYAVRFDGRDPGELVETARSARLRLDDALARHLARAG